MTVSCHRILLSCRRVVRFDFLHQLMSSCSSEDELSHMTVNSFSRWLTWFIFTGLTKRLHSRLDTTRLRMVLSSRTEISMSWRETTNRFIVSDHLQNIQQKFSLRQLTSPDSWANMDLKESSMLLSEISSCTEEEQQEAAEVKGHLNMKPARRQDKEKTINLYNYFTSVVRTSSLTHDVGKFLWTLNISGASQ